MYYHILSCIIIYYYILSFMDHLGIIINPEEIVVVFFDTAVVFFFFSQAVTGLKPLSSWMPDLGDRIEQLNTWGFVGRGKKSGAWGDLSGPYG